MKKRNVTRENVIEQRYVPTVWHTGDIITAAKLNKLEDQVLLNDQNIATIDEAVKSLPPFVVTFSGLTGDGNAACDKTHAEVKAAYDSGKQITARYVAGTSIFQLTTNIELSVESEYDYLWGDYSTVYPNGTSIHIECRMDSREVTASSDTFEVSIPVPNPDNPSNNTK